MNPHQPATKGLRAVPAAAAKATGPTLTTSGKRKLAKGDRSPFTIDGVTYQLIRPKTAMLGELASLIDPNRPFDEQSNARAIMQYTVRVIDYIEATPRDRDTGQLTGRAHIRQRINDPEDDLDLEDLMPILVEMMSGWFGRPTGSPRGSTQRRTASRTGGSRANTR